MSEISQTSLSYIHRRANRRKALGYWIGFLEGVMACKEITYFEAEALKAQSLDLLALFFDEDAQELLVELGQNWPQLSEELGGFIEDIIRFRRSELGLEENVVNQHLFFGFLKGIASDDIVNLNEVTALIEHFSNKKWENETVQNDPRIRDIFKVAELAIQDGVIDKQESQELCGYISKVVGDSFADTGISSQFDTPQLDGILHSIEEVTFEGMEFCLTGTFKVPKAVLTKAIEELGGAVNKEVRNSTDYVVLSNEGSEHYVTANAGTKIIKAIKLRESKGKPHFVMESTISSVIHLV